MLWDRFCCRRNWWTSESRWHYVEITLCGNTDIYRDQEKVKASWRFLTWLVFQTPKNEQMKNGSKIASGQKKNVLAVTRYSSQSYGEVVATYPLFG